MHHCKTYMYQVSTSVETVHTNLFAKNVNCINLQFAILILKITPFGHALPPNGQLGRI